MRISLSLSARAVLIKRIKTVGIRPSHAGFSLLRCDYENHIIDNINRRLRDIFAPNYVIATRACRS